MERGRMYCWTRLLWPVTGILALIWFLVRVIPKPSRAVYPCQRIAAPLASGFIVWLTSMIVSTLAYWKARSLLRQSRYVIASFFFIAAVVVVWGAISIIDEDSALAEFIPSDPPNAPMGIGKGIHPGRVVWVHEPDVTRWDGQTGDWWYDENTDQDLTNFMVAEAIRSLTGQQDDADAWDTLFRHINRANGHGDVGYQQDERITIKLNMNADGSTIWLPHRPLPSPQVIYALVAQLVHMAGVPGEAITLYDASRYIGDPIYEKIRGNPDPNFQHIEFVVRPDRANNGRQSAEHDPANPIYFAAPDVTGGLQAYLPRCVTEAKYLINMALLRAHKGFGVTACGKNHFGSIYFPDNGGWEPMLLHGYGYRNAPMGGYNCLVDLIGHRHLGGKTLLYLIDGLYGSKGPSGEVIRYASFGDDWSSSLFVSQDPVAIDSVALDFIRNEPLATACRGRGVDNYLHEAALASNPPSRTFYDPEGDGVRLESLGVHEHWNNTVDKQYSRNLGIGEGIELVVPQVGGPNGPVENMTAGIRYNHIRYALNEAQAGDEIVVSPGVYRETINFKGKNVLLRSTNPYDPVIAAATVIFGGDRAVQFSGGEDESCILSGLTITGARYGISCSKAGPTITHCWIVDNRDSGIKLWTESHPVIVNSIVAGNTGAGIEMWAEQSEQMILFNYTDVTNCTIVGNALQGIYGGWPTVTSSIIRQNGTSGDFAQIEAYSAAVRYCNISGVFPGEGNVDHDPSFKVPGYWSDPNDPDAFWIHGDYHLRSDSPCINAGDPDFVATPDQYDMDGEPRVRDERVDIGADEVGEIPAGLKRDG